MRLRSILMALLLLIAASLPVLAADQYEVKFSTRDSQDVTVGLGYNLRGDLWLAGNVDHLGSDPDVSVSGLFVVPKEFLFFTIYGGVGVHFGSTPEPQVIAGSRFWMLFSEYEYPLSGGDGYHRSGFRIGF